MERERERRLFGVQRAAWAAAQHSIQPVFGRLAVEVTAGCSPGKARKFRTTHNTLLSCPIVSLEPSVRAGGENPVVWKMFH